MINPRPAVELTREGSSTIIITSHPRSRSGMTSLKRSAKNMGTAQIKKVAVLDDGRFAVFPDRKEPSWQYVYREACGVYWNHELGCFHSGEPPRTWGYKEWYEQIVSVVKSGVGLRMRLDSDAEFDSDAPGFADDVRTAEASVQKWIDDGCPPPE